MASANQDERIVARVAIQHGIVPEAVRTVLSALRSGGGTMAQFSHPAFGGMSQWSPGMTMVGDMFNTQLQSKLDSVCRDLAAYLADPNVSGDRNAAPPNSFRSSPASSWWPADLGQPSSAGGQNDLRYAFFPIRRRLAISDAGRIHVYDTGNHAISGVSQAQSNDQTITFTSQHGIVSIAELPVVTNR